MPFTPLQPEDQPFKTGRKTKPESSNGRPGSSGQVVTGFTKEVLQKAANEGSKKVAEALRKLSKSDVKSSVAKVETVSLQASLDNIKIPGKDAAIVYAELLSGVPGASFLMMRRNDALVLADLLNRRPVGTTQVLEKIDESAIKETLNILSNYYMTALFESASINLGLGVPDIITSARLKRLVKTLIAKDAHDGDFAIVFETATVITKHEVRADLYIIFKSKTVENIQS